MPVNIHADERQEQIYRDKHSVCMPVYIHTDERQEQIYIGKHSVFQSISIQKRGRNIFTEVNILHASLYPYR